jgi:lipoprotein signal peptidase
MTDIHGRVKPPGSRLRPVGAHRPGGPRPHVTQLHRRAAGSARRGATARRARERGRAETASQIPISTPLATRREGDRKKRPSQWFIVLALLAAVIVIDQAAKWWAWRHVPGVSINPGGDLLTGPVIGRWYADPITGALLDLVDFGLVSIAVVILGRRPRPAAVTVCGSLMVGGWASNLFDRLGVHYMSAPGSIRGAVDFIGLYGRCWNLADFSIIGATPLFLLATAQLAKRAASRPTTSSARPAIRNALRARMPAVAFAGAALVITAALGATHHGSLTRPAHTRTTTPLVCANSRTRTAVSHPDLACTTEPFRTAVRR